MIDLTYESVDDGDGNTVVSPHRKRAGGSESHKANAVPSIGSFSLVDPFHAASPGLLFEQTYPYHSRTSCGGVKEILLEEAPSSLVTILP